MIEGVSQQILSETTIAKLAEMEKTRNRLENHYATVLQNSLEADSKQEELAILRQGLVEVGEHHQHLRDTSMVQEQIAYPSYYGEDGINRWISKLRKEIESGRRRQLQSKLFSNILDEYLKGTANDAKAEVPSRDIDMVDFEAIPSESSETAIADQLKKMFTPSPNKIDMSILNSIVNANQFQTVSYQVDSFQQEMKNGSTKVTKGEAKAAIMNIIKKGLVFDQAVIDGLLESANNDVTVSELANLLSIRLKDFETWDWDRKDKIPTLRFTKFSNGKLRAFLDADFMNLLFLQVVGTKWSVFLRSMLSSYCDPLINAPYTTGPINQYRTGRVFLSSLPTSLEEERADTYQTTQKEEETINETPLMDGVQDRLDSLHKLSTWITRHRTTRPTEGLIVGFFDVEDFSNSIPHKVVLQILAKFGVNQDWLSFFERFLTPDVKVKGRDTKGKIQRGLPLRYALSFLFGELVMFFVDTMIEKKNDFASGQLTIGYHRTMDDCYLWTTEPKVMAEAYRDFKKVLNCFGMNVNEEKSGHCDITFNYDHSHPVMQAFLGRSMEFKKLNGELKQKTLDPKSLKSLPQGPVKWGFLKLDKTNGIWKVDMEKVKEFKTSMVAKVKAGTSLMSQVNIYNSQLNFFKLFIGEYDSSMGRTYLESSLNALDQFHGHFEEGKTALQYFLGEIKSRFIKDDDLVVPEAWLYWPVTAGGLGLKHPLIENFAYLHSASDPYWHPSYISHTIPNNWDPYSCTKLEPPAIKKKTGSPTGTIAWNADESLERLFTWFKRGVEFEVDVSSAVGGEPTYSEEFNKLVAMFCKRGTAMRERAQTNLSLYWKWIVFNYSEQILDAFGSLEFAAAGSVPLHLILSIKRESH